MLLYSLVVLRYAGHGHALTTTRWPLRSWYRHKKGLSFDDMLVTLRRASLRLAIDPRVMVAPATAKSQPPRALPDALTRWSPDSRGLGALVTRGLAT